MKIALTGYFFPIPGIYGAERVIYYLIQEYLSLGHEPVLFSVKGCNPGCPVVEMPVYHSEIKDLYHEAIVDYENKHSKFDVIHSYMASGKIDLDYWKKRPYCLEPFYATPNSVANKVIPEKMIACSKIMNKINGGKNKVIYYGIPDIGKISLSEDYLVWCGRISPGKGTDQAIEIANRAGKKIIIMGQAFGLASKEQINNYNDYFIKKIYPKIDQNKVIWLRGCDDDVKIRVLRKAKGFLACTWDNYHEMFGLVNLEALRSGVPIITTAHKTQLSAINNGEVISSKEGFIVEYKDYTEDEREKAIIKAVECVKQLDELNRQDCYNLFKNRFTSRISAENHLNFYTKL